MAEVDQRSSIAADRLGGFAVKKTVITSTQPANLAVVSLFCGPGGFDLGFEQAGFSSILALDANRAACKTFRRNHRDTVVFVRDLSQTGPEYIIDRLRELPEAAQPVGVIGGPPCQAFSMSNGYKKQNDPRADLPRHYAAILKELNQQFALDFFVFENVVGIKHSRHEEQFSEFKELFKAAGFNIFEAELDAADFGVAQYRRRVFLVGVNARKHSNLQFEFPSGDSQSRSTVRELIGHLPDPALFQRGLIPQAIPHHANHWTMQPRSIRFQNGTLKEGESKGRPFRVLRWDEPSWTVAYGNREVHVHPQGKRRLSVYEAMRLQGFPHDYIFEGTLSDQIRMVSDAVAPPVAKAIAEEIRRQVFDISRVHFKND